MLAREHVHVHVQVHVQVQVHVHVHVQVHVHVAYLAHRAALTTRTLLCMPFVPTHSYRSASTQLRGGRGQALSRRDASVTPRLSPACPSAVP